jgi:hypothetical protein
VILVDYKNAGFGKLVLDRERSELSVGGLGEIGYFEKDLYDKVGDKVFDDYINFVVCV